MPPSTGVGVVELLAKTTTLSDCTLNISILDDFTKNRLVEISTEAVTDPVAMLDKFKPTIADAGILNKLAPEPE
jgi:hypothetical protein